MRAPLLAIVLVLAPLSSRSASAQVDPAFIAQQRYDEGLRAYEAGELDAALESFRASFSLTHSPNVRLMIARALRNLGRNAEALIEYELTQREAADRAMSEARFGATRDAAASEGAEVSARVGRVRIAIAPRPEGLAIEVAGRGVPVEALGVALPVDQGTIVVRATAPGHVATERTIEIVAGATSEVSLELVAEGAAAPPREEVTERRREIEPERSGSGTPAIEVIAWSSAGVAIVAAGAATALFVAAQSRYDGLVAQCGASPCPPALAGSIAEGRSFETGAWVAIAIAGAAAVGAIVAFVVASGERDETARARAVREGAMLRW